MAIPRPQSQQNKTLPPSIMAATLSPGMEGGQEIAYCGNHPLLWCVKVIDAAERERGRGRERDGEKRLVKIG